MMMMILQAFHRAWINLKKQIISSKKISHLNLFNTFAIDPLIVFTSCHYRLKSFLKLGILSFFNILTIDKEEEPFLILNYHRRRLHLFLIPSAPFSRSTERLLKFLAVSQSSVPEFPNRCSFKVRHGRF